MSEYLGILFLIDTFFYFYKEENIRVCCSFSVNIISVYKLQHRHNLNIFIMSIVK